MNAANVVLHAVQQALEDNLRTWVARDDDARVFVVKIGPLQGDPDLDLAPIHVELYTNDPEHYETWPDEELEREIGGTIIWKRRFSLLFRALLVDSAETLEESLVIAAKLKERIEVTLRTMSWANVASDDEQADFLLSLKTEMNQGGGPDAYDWLGKTWFEVVTRTL